MYTLIIQHTGGTNHLHVTRMVDGKRTTRPVEILLQINVRWTAGPAT